MNWQQLADSSGIGHFRNHSNAHSAKPSNIFSQGKVNQFKLLLECALQIANNDILVLRTTWDDIGSIFDLEPMEAVIWSKSES
jgi:hypothetical protein